jgi:hypothetical protein
MGQILQGPADRSVWSIWLSQVGGLNHLEKYES